MTVINNYFSRARLDYYTRPQGLEKEPKLPPKLAGPLHKIIMGTNLNPVKVGDHRTDAVADLQDCFLSQWSIKQDFWLASDPHVGVSLLLHLTSPFIRDPTWPLRLNINNKIRLKMHFHHSAQSRK